eukprot:gene14156-15634_t
MDAFVFNQCFPQPTNGSTTYAISGFVLPVKILKAIQVFLAQFDESMRIGNLARSRPAELLCLGLFHSTIKETIVTSSNDDLPINPVLQILGIKKLQASAGVDRYRVVLSDGINFYSSGMLATQLNDLVLSGDVEARAVVQLDKYTCNIIQGTRKVLVVLEMTVLETADMNVKIGAPQQLTDQISVLEKMAAEGQNNVANNMQSRPMPQQQKPNTNNQNQYSNPAPVKPATGQQQQQQNKGMANGRPNPYGNVASNSAFYSGGSKMSSNPAGGAPGGVVVHPISSLTPYQNRWTIRARVTNKSPIRTWNNSKGEGKLFNCDLLDESGEIRATAFQQACDSFYEKLEVGKVYYISKGSLRTANKQYSSLKNDYEMYLNTDSTVELCTDTNDLPQVQFNFVNIADLENVNKDSMVDIIGVVKSMQDVVKITIRSTNREVSKREINVVDRSETAVNATLWGDTADKFNQYENQNPIIAVKGAKVSDFGGRSLSVLTSSVFQVNPDIPAAHALRGWYDQGGKDSGMKSISGMRSDSISGQFKTLEQVRSEELGMKDKPDYFSIKATPVFLKKDNCLYKACPSADCNKKVIEDGDEYRCEKCNKTYQTFKYRLILNANISDFTGSIWITCFQESAEAMLHETAEKIGEMRESDEQAFEDIFSEAAFKPFALKLRAKMETYNDENRFKVTCVQAQPLNFQTDGKRLLEEIKKLEAL